MNKRMHAIVKYIEPGRGLIDVGTDHGHLPAWMAAHGYRGNIIAADINEAPLQKARENVISKWEGSICLKESNVKRQQHLHKWPFLGDYQLGCLYL